MCSRRLFDAFLMQCLLSDSAKNTTCHCGRAGLWGTAVQVDNHADVAQGEYPCHDEANSGSVSTAAGQN